MSFIVDSGCSQHMVPSHYALTNEKECDISVSIADGSKLHAKKTGSLKLNAEGGTIVLSNVLAVKDLSTPLFSVLGATEHGCKVTFFNDGTGEIIDENEQNKISFG